MTHNLAKIRGKTAYSTQEICQLLMVNRKTILRWFKEGLAILAPAKKPLLVMGSDLQAFIKAKRDAKRVKLNWNEFYCLKCSKAVLAKRGSERTEKTGKNIGAENREQEIIYANCKDCSTPVARFI